MPDLKLVTFNNLIPSHLMKFLNWQDEDDLGAEVSEDEQLRDEGDEDVEEVV